jgi:hypothetical protein
LAQPPAVLRYQDVPWPPSKTGILAGYAAWLQQQGGPGPRPGSRSAAFQEAFKMVRGLLLGCEGHLLLGA